MSVLTAAALATTVVTELVKTIGKSGGEGLISLVRRRFQSDDKAKAVLTNFEQDPDEYSDNLRKHLERLLTDDAAFRQQLADALAQGSTATVVGTDKATIDGVDQDIQGSGHRARVEGSGKSKIKGVKQKIRD